MRHLKTAVTATGHALELVTTQYIDGITDFQNILDTQRSLFKQQDQFAESQGRVAVKLISLYKAMGGGWDVQMVPSGVLPREMQFNPPAAFVIKLRLKGEYPDYPLHFGATGIATVFTSESPDVFKFLRQIEIRSESYLNYVFNPF